MPLLRRLACTLVLLFLALVPRAASQPVVSGTTYTVNGGSTTYVTFTVRDGGTLVLNSGTIKTINQIYIGRDSPGTAFINGGLLDGPAVYVGYAGTTQDYGGTVIQTGGTVSAATAIGLRDTTSTYVLNGGLASAGYLGFLSTGTHTNSFLLNSGTLRIGGIAGLDTTGASLTFNGGVLALSGTSPFGVSGPVDFFVDAGGAVVETGSSGIGFFTSLSHSGTAAIDGGLTISGGGRVTLNAASNNYTGRTVINSGTLVLTGSIENSTVVVNGGRLATGGRNTIGALSGGGTVDLAVFGPSVLQAGRNNETTTFSGTITGYYGSLLKEGAGALTLTGQNTYNNGTFVNSGTLVLAGSPTGGIGIVRGSLAIDHGVVVASSNNALGYGNDTRVTSVVIDSGTLISTAAADQGWGIFYVLNNDALLSSNNGVSSATAGSKFAFGGTTGQNTSVLVETGSSTIAGRVDLRSDNGNVNSNFTVNAGATLNVTAAVTNSGSAVNLVKLGDGRMILSGSNTYSGTTRISAGTLVARNDHAMGTGTVVVDGGVFIVDPGYDVPNSVVLSGGLYRRTLAGSLAGAIHDTSATPGGDPTSAAILASTVSGVTVTTGFSASSSAGNDYFRRSDVYNFDGTGTGIFVLELSFTSTEPASVLAWLSGNQWVNAVLGNTGNTATEAMMAYEGTFAEFLAEFQPTYGTGLGNYLGAYGTDITGGTTTVWAVLNHNSAFAAIPEPGTMALLGLGGLMLLRRR